MECHFCKNTYANQYILKTHQQTTKKCILLQKQVTNQVNNEIKFKCSYCHKILSSKSRLDTHYSTCKSKIKKDSETLTTKKIVEEKQDELEEVSFKLRSEKEQIEYELRKAIQEKDAKIKELESKLEYNENKGIVRTNKLEIKEYKFGTELVVPIRNDGMINATALCKAGNKTLGHYLENKNTKEFIKVLESDIGIPISRLLEVNIGGHLGTWVHRKVGYHLAQWISPEFAVHVSNVLDELFITGSVISGKEKSSNEIELSYQNQIKELHERISKNEIDYKTLLVKHNSTLKTHRYIKFKESGPCFYIIEQGIPCECKYNISRKKFGVAGLSKNDEKDTIDDRLKSHRTNWPQLKINYILFLKDAEIIEQSIKRIYANEINPNGHEIIEGVSSEQLITSITKIIESLCINDYKVLSADKIKEYNDYVVTTVKVK